VAGCFVHERHARAWDLPRFAGWWGHNEGSRFEMAPEFQPMSGAEGWQLSNPSIVTLAVLRASMDIFQEAGMDRLREKSARLTSYLEFLLGELFKQRGTRHFWVVTPPESKRRGAQISIGIRNKGKMLCESLNHMGVFGDWREPDTFRVAPVPLYNSYRDVFRFVQRFGSLIA
jgi:kynureninase